MLESYQNYLNIPEEKRDHSIYRVMSIERLKEAFDSAELAMVRPKMWDDPFENWLLKSYGITPDGRHVNFTKIMRTFYGQCWTFHRETDAMWRIYAPEKRGVKIRTTIRKLLEALYSSSKDYPELSCFIGKVEYLPVEDIEKRLTCEDPFASFSKGISKTLLLKRPEFEHESEVRLIFSQEFEKATNDIHKFHIKPNKLIEEIVFDPRMEEECFEAFRDEIIDKGYSKPMEQSQLYRAPEALKIPWSLS